ncbi:MAG: helix-turn-helix transcriptional regulator [Erysipelotrichaceae bacterium]|nr:helix-turn-helix transcriptional regulator [Erysipelotrichaceae bacterium]
MNYQDIGKRIKQRRTELNLTQQELAEKLQVTNKAVSKWETGEGYPDISILSDISSALVISVDDLLGSSFKTTIQTKKSDLNLIYRMILLGSVPLIYLLPMMERYAMFGFGENWLGASGGNSLSGYAIILQSPLTSWAQLTFISLMLIYVISVMLLVEYGLNHFKEIELFPFLKKHKNKKRMIWLLILSLPIPLYVGLMTGVEIGLILMPMIITLYVYLELKTLKYKS